MGPMGKEGEMDVKVFFFDQFQICLIQLLVMIVRRTKHLNVLEYITYYALKVEGHSTV